VATKKEMRTEAFKGEQDSRKLVKRLLIFSEQLPAFDETTWNTQIEVYCRSVQAIADKFKMIRDALKQRITTEQEEMTMELELTALCGFDNSTEFLTHLQKHGKQLQELTETKRKEAIVEYCEEVQEFAEKFKLIKHALKQMKD
jgi:hypothetical protein